MAPSDQTKKNVPPAGDAARRVVLVGHCGFDQASLSRAVAAALPDVPIETAHDRDNLDRLATADALLLVNRVLDGRFATASGIELIAELARRDPPPRQLLISNYPDALAQAQQAGALPGFGKSELMSPSTAVLLKQAAGFDTD